MKLIPLSQWGKNKGKYFAIVDDEDFERISEYKWYARSTSKSNKIYASRTERKTERKEISMTNQILNFESDHRIMIDHINFDGLDNRKSNLRICTAKQNMMHRQKHKKNLTSLYKGVSWHKQGKKWRADIYINNKCTFLGYFESETDAARTYNKKAKEEFGEFAVLNKIREDDSIGAKNALGTMQKPKVGNPSFKSESFNSA